MSDTEQYLTGARVSREELFDHVLSLAGFIQDLASQAAVQHEETAFFLKEIRTSNSQSQQQIFSLVEQVKLRSSTERRSQNDFRNQWLAVAVGQILLTSALVGLILWWIPSLDEVRARQNEIAKIRDEKTLLSLMVRRGDETWVPTLDSLATCTPPSSKNCITFARIQ